MWYKRGNTNKSFQKQKGGILVDFWWFKMLTVYLPPSPGCSLAGGPSFQVLSPLISCYLATVRYENKRQNAWKNTTTK